MKNETLNGILTFTLGVLVVLGVWFALKVVFVTKQSRAWEGQALQDNARIVETQGLFNDGVTYNQKYPSTELSHILQSFQQSLQARPANR